MNNVKVREYKEKCAVMRSCSRENKKFGHFTLFCWGRQRNVPKCKMHVQSNCFCSLAQFLWCSRCRPPPCCLSSTLISGHYVLGFSGLSLPSHCSLALGILHHTLCLHSNVWIVAATCYWGDPSMHFHPLQGWRGVVVVPVASCCGNWFNLCGQPFHTLNIKSWFLA